MREHGGEFATTPLGMEGAMLKGVLIDEAVEILFEFAGHFGPNIARLCDTRSLHEVVLIVAYL